MSEKPLRHPYDILSTPIKSFFRLTLELEPRGRVIVFVE
jgi:hypothetical protein